MKARENPFRTERLLKMRYRFHGTTWDELLRRFESMDYRAALIGSHGAGKTTLLEDFVPQLRERGFDTELIRLDGHEPRFRPGFVEALLGRLTPNHIVLLDGAEQLNWAAWKYFEWQTRHAGGLLITTHQAGRLPTLYHCATSDQLLARIAADLLHTTEHSTGPLAESLFHKHRGNLRDALREWYDIASESAEGRTRTA